MGFINNYIDKRIEAYILNADHQIDLSQRSFSDDEYDLIQNRIWFNANKDILLRFYNDQSQHEKTCKSKEGYYYRYHE